MSQLHNYHATITWTGNTGSGTGHYTSYERSYTVMAPGKSELQCSADPMFRGDASLYNPEDMLLASLSSCHMLWFLHLCADAGINVTAYVDRPQGTMQIDATGGGRFTAVILQPEVTLAASSDAEKAKLLHEEANKKCFIASSCNFPVRHEVIINFEEEKTGSFISAAERSE